MNIPYVCPTCKLPLVSGDAALSCSTCGTSYPITNGVPVFDRNISTDMQEYWDSHGCYGQSEPYLLEFLNGKKYGTALDLGCGEGRSMAPLLGIVDTFYGIDTSPEYMRPLIQQNLPNVRLACADAKHMPFADNSFDLIVSLSVVEHIPWKELSIVLTEAKRVLKPDGIFLVRNDAWFYYVLEVLRIRPGQFGKKPDITHINMMTGFRFAHALHAAGFEIVREDHFPFYRLEKIRGIRAPRFIARLFATHSNFILRKRV
jgi:ubiquinone/menaquinone biosynthesis C-methylase UbiE